MAAVFDGFGTGLMEGRVDASLRRNRGAGPWGIFFDVETAFDSKSLELGQRALAIA